MSADTNQAKSIDAISDCSKWISTISTGAITAIGFFIKDKPSVQVTISKSVSIPCAVAVFFFILSILCSAWLLSSVPEAYTDINEKESVYDRRVGILGLKFLDSVFYKVFHRQFTCFFLGLIGFSVAIIASFF